MDAFLPPGIEAIEARTFMHLMATYFPFLMDCALSTSENVPSPFLATSRYLCMLAAYVLLLQRRWPVLVLQPCFPW